MKNREVRQIISKHGGLPASVFALILAACILQGCGGGGGGVSRGTPLISPSSMSMAGRVVDENNASVSGVTVTVNGGGNTATSGADGSFILPLGTVSASGASVRLALSKAGYVDDFPTVRISPDSLVNGIHSVTLCLRRAPDTAAEATQAEILLNNGTTQSVAPTAATEGGLTVYNTTVNVTAGVAAVTFSTPGTTGVEPDVSFTIGSANGDPALAVLGAAGAVTGAISYGNPLDAADLQNFPGTFTTTSDTGGAPAGEGALITAGFARVTLERADGTAITQFASGTYATIRMNVPAGVVDPETGAAVRMGDTIPVFVFNESTGQWVVEHNGDGSVKRAVVQQAAAGTLFVEFTTTHLTTFNLDWKSDLCPENTPRVRFVDEQGNPVTGVTLYADANGWKELARTVSDSDATFYRAPAEIEWKLFARKGDTNSGIVNIRGCKNAATDSGDFDVVLHPATQGGQGPAADINASPTSGMAPLTVYFSRICTSDAAICELYSWDFGDGKPEVKGLTPTHTYTTAGTYIVTLTAISSSGATEQATSTITVSDYSGPGWYKKLSYDNLNVWPTAFSLTGDGALVAGIAYNNIDANFAFIARVDSSGNVIGKYPFASSNIFDIQPTADGGYIAAGWNFPGAWLMKLDASLSVQWEKNYEFSDAYSVKQTGDGGYIVGGSNRIWDDNISYDIPVILKTDGDGNREWDKQYEKTAFYSEPYPIQTIDGGYLFAHNKYTIVSEKESLNDMYLVKLDAQGNQAWETKFENSSGTRGNILALADGGSVIAYEYCPGDSYCRGIIGKINASGTETSRKEYNFGYLTSLWVASDGGYIVASWDGFFKIGAAGELVWSKSTNWINYLVVGAAGIQQADGTYLAATGQFWGNSTDDTWMIKMDSNMNGPGVTSNDAAPRTANRANARPDRNMLMRHPPAKR